MSKAEVARRTGVSRAQLRSWLAAGLAATLASPMRAGSTQHVGDVCERRAQLDEAAYAYLLGQYLGDGCLSLGPRGVWRLRISACDAYPGIKEEIASAVGAVLPGRHVGYIGRQGCTELYSNSKHWICLFPQHGPGRKHERTITLEPWQEAIAVNRHPDRLVRGLVHSDGCRVINRVRGANGVSYAYLRYFLTNESADILQIFESACDRLEVEHRRNNRNSVSVARRASVAKLDVIVGPKY
ncbi:MAG: hypothetical protein H0W25_20870 [Acidimicrobiia bacterium]|nr:hypothetical protein [Acidimicrobiia bacterium]